MIRILSTAAVLALVALSGCKDVTLSDLATAACKAQEAANIAGRIAGGSPEWAARFAEASRIAGLGCSW